MPADSDATRDGATPYEVHLPRTYRPLGARVATATAAVAIVVAMTFLWLMLPGNVQDDFTTFQRITLVAFFVAILVLLNAIFRTSARATESGLEVVNGYRRRFLEWGQIVRISLSPNRPWALMDLDDGTTQAVMAIQTSDGARAIRSAKELARVIARHTPTDHDT
ncbi:MAG TPA: PH domain-containing protein [Nocardioidaceae bacterium]|jgi:hypothetical protein